MSIIPFLFLTILFSTGCSYSGLKKENLVPSENKKINIVAAEFIEYDFVKQIVKDKAEVSMLLPPGVEGHDYQASAKDILTVSKADVFFFSGTKVEPWVDKVINSNFESSVNAVDISSKINFIKSEFSDNKEIIDPHIYLDLGNACTMLENILDAVCKKDPENARFYKDNANEYKEKILNLDLKIKNLIDSSKLKKIVFAGRFAGIYFVKRYSLNYISAYPTCDSKSEPDANKILEIITFVKSNKIPAIFYEETEDIKLAKAISNETGAKILKFNTIHTVDKSQFDKGVTYASLMQKNLESLKKALV